MGCLVHLYRLQCTTQQPDAHRAQISSNILRAWLSAKQIDFFAQRTPPSWYTPIKDKVSIVIPVWNNLQLVKQCVQSILTFTLHPFEIILVDNASHEPIAIWAEPMAAKHANITYVRNTINHGFPQGCNIGIAHATGDHILPSTAIPSSRPIGSACSRPDCNEMWDWFRECRATSVSQTSASKRLRTEIPKNSFGLPNSKAPPTTAIKPKQRRGFSSY